MTPKYEREEFVAAILTAGLLAGAPVDEKAAVQRYMNLLKTLRETQGAILKDIPTR